MAGTRLSKEGVKNMKKIVLGLILALTLAPLAYAAVDAGNALCPVSGDKVSGKDFVEVAGKQYGLCCAMCADKLTKNPDKYLGKDAAENHDDSM